MTRTRYAAPATAADDELAGAPQGALSAPDRIAGTSALLNFGSGDMLQKMFGLIERWRAANSEDYSHTV